jgi:hypothetical protein
LLGLLYSIIDNKNWVGWTVRHSGGASTGDCLLCQPGKIEQKANKEHIMKITGVAAILAVATADMVSDCRDTISSTESAWVTTCQRWCDEYSVGQCKTATTGNELVSCIMQIWTYCINDPSKSPAAEDQLVKACQDSITSEYPEWISSCQAVCKEFLPGKKVNTACSNAIVDGPSMALCLADTYDYCVLKTA